MKLRSGARLTNDNANVSERRYNIFDVATEDLVCQLNDSVCEIDRLHLDYALYTYIDNNKDDLYEFILDNPQDMVGFITDIADYSVIFIKDLLYYCQTEPDLNIGKTNGIEEARMVYELMNVIYCFLDKLPYNIEVNN